MGDLGTWVLVLTVAFLLGALSWAVPSPRERRLARMRQLAMMEGLDIVIGRDGDPPGVCYRLACAPSFPGWSLRTSGGKHSGAPFHAGWRWETEPAPNALSLDIQEALIRALEALGPLQDGCVRSTLTGVELWWDEQGGAEQINAVRGFLYTLQHSLAPSTGAQSRGT
ncbi:MAG: hypothetical protein ISN29_02890 [Gammaproteobacteria bacterium AqS3]|nr:hypothetical protein [Gammaproteobacteria bacterium AqS3]